MSRVVETIVRRNPTIESARFRMAQAEAASQEAGRMRLPQIGLHGSVMRGNNPVYVFGSLLEQGRFGPQNFAVSFLNDPPDLTHWRGGIGAGLPVFTGFELSTQNKLAELGRIQAEEGVSQASQQVRFQALASYLQAVYARTLAEAIQSRVGSGSREIANAEKLRDRGLVLGSDYFVAESIREGLKGWQIQVASEQRIAEQRLSVLAGSPVAVSSASLREWAYEVAGLEALKAAALADRPDLRIARLAVEGAQAREFQAKSSLLPRADAFATLDANTEDFSSAPSNHLYGMRLNVPLGDPAYGPRRDRFKAEREARAQELSALVETIEVEVIQAAESHRTAVDLLKSAKATRERAAKALELFRPLYKSGRQSVMEVLRAEEGLAQAEANYQKALFGVHAGWARLQLAIGHLDSRTVEKIASAVELK